MTQAPGLDGLALYFFALLQDFRRPPVISIGGCHVAQALMVTSVVVMLDEGGDLLFEITGQIIVFKQDAVFQGLVPSLDLALGLWMARGSSYVLDVSAFEPFRQIASDITRPIIG